MLRPLIGLAGLLLCAAVPAAEAQDHCAFEYEGATMRLLGDCATDAPLLLPDGVTLDGNGHTIWAVDPPGGAFHGGVITSTGSAASVVDVTIMGLRLADSCQSGARRLRGILFEGASGVIRGVHVLHLTRGLSGCQEGNAIEVRALDRADAPVTVEITANVIDGYQKTGVVITGLVDAWIHHNYIGASATQPFLPANALQIGPGARGIVEENRIAGNSWPHADAAATAILLLGSAPGTVVRRNEVFGNADVGIYVLADGVTVAHNVLDDTGPDGFYDVGIGNYGRDNLFIGNVVRGYATPLENVQEVPAPGMIAAP